MADRACSISACTVGSAACRCQAAVVRAVVFNDELEILHGRIRFPAAMRAKTGKRRSRTRVITGGRSGVGQILIELLIHLPGIPPGRGARRTPAAQLHGGSGAVKFQAPAAAPAIPFQLRVLFMACPVIRVGVCTWQGDITESRAAVKQLFEPPVEAMSKASDMAAAGLLPQHRSRGAAGGLPIDNPCGFCQITPRVQPVGPSAFWTAAHSRIGDGPMQIIPCPGFKTAGVAAGIKKNGRSDLGLIVSDVPASVAGVFTRNQIQAAPVRLDRERSRRGLPGRAREQRQRQLLHRRGGLPQRGPHGPGGGLRAERSGRRRCSSPLPCHRRAAARERIESALPGLLRGLKSEGVMDFAECHHDHRPVPKVVSRQGGWAADLHPDGGREGGRDDPAGCGHMLCFLMTDIAAAPDALREMLVPGPTVPFNRITVDGDTAPTTHSAAGQRSGGGCGGLGRRPGAFQTVLDEVMLALAKWW